MQNLFYHYFVLVFISAVATLRMAYLAWQRRPSRGAAMLAMLLLSVSWWSWLYGLELLWPGLPSKLFLLRLKYLGIVLCPVLMLGFTLDYTRQSLKHPGRYIVALLAVPVLTLLAVWINPNQLFIANSYLDTSYILPVLRTQHGILFWVHTAYSYLLLAIGVAQLGYAILHSTSRFRPQLLAVLIVTIVPWAANAVHVFNGIPTPAFDLTPLAFVISGFGLYVALFRLGLLDMAPIARNAVVENMQDGMLVIDLDDRIVDMNPALAKWLGMEPDDGIGHRLDEVFRPNVARRLADHHDESTTIEVGITFLDQTSIFEVRSSIIRNRRAGMIGRVMMMRDVTERKKIEREEREQRLLAEVFRDTAAVINSTIQLDAVLNLILTNIGRVVPHDAAHVLLFDAEGNISRTRFHGYNKEEKKYILELAKTFISVEDWRESKLNRGAVVISDASAADRIGPHTLTDRMHAFLDVPIHYKGRLIGLISLACTVPDFFNDTHASRLQGFADQAAIAIENARLYAEVQHLTLTDELTRLYNYRGLVELGQREFDRAVRFQRPLSLLFFDIDHFRDFNNRYTHAVGNMVLQSVAKSAVSCLRGVDLIARYGGEEFVVLLPETSAASALEIAERLREVIEGTAIKTTFGSLNVTVSVGVAEYGGKVSNLAALIDMANHAEHRAKRGGRNRVMEYSGVGHQPHIIEPPEDLQPN